MVKTFDKEVKSTKKYARALMVLGLVFVLLVGGFGIYSGVYVHTKNKLEKNFEKQLKENAFHKNKEGFYSMNYKDGVVYSVPNQSMPDLLDFSLEFHVSNVYCDVDLEDSYVEIIWENGDRFYASARAKKDDVVIGSTSEFKDDDFSDMKKLGDELGMSEEEISQIMDKGKELCEDFYGEK